MTGSGLGIQAAVAVGAENTHESSNMAKIAAIPTREARRPAHLELRMITENYGFPRIGSLPEVTVFNFFRGRQASGGRRQAICDAGRN